MAKRRSGKRYRMTPRRRAALKKAQQASARKRRNQNVKNAMRVAGYVAAATAASTAAYAINNESRKFAKNPEKYVRDVKGYARTKFGKKPKNPVPRPPAPKNPSLKLKSIPWTRSTGRRVKR